MPKVIELHLDCAPRTIAELARAYSLLRAAIAKVCTNPKQDAGILEKMNIACNAIGWTLHQQADTESFEKNLVYLEQIAGPVVHVIVGPPMCAHCGAEVTEGDPASHRCPDSGPRAAPAAMN